jgi:hypothetical protein
MPRGLVGPAATLVAFVLAACGGGSSNTPSTAAASPGTSTSSSTVSSSASSAQIGPHPPKPHKKAGSSTTTSSAAATSSSTTTQGTTQNAPSPTPTGTPPAPAGLARTTGYGTYELCAGTCGGAVSDSLRRPLHVSGPGSGCPVSSGGIVRPAPTDLRLQTFLGSSWLGAQLTWTAAASYQGPVLIRGRQAGGSGVVGFGEGHTPYDELQLLDSGQQAPPHPSGSRAWLTLTRVKGPGCYAFQVDTEGSSTVVYLRATG